MQCPSCQFENMPGVKACGRCGASLQLRAAAISVHPPRASAWAKRWRRHFWWPLALWRGTSGWLAARVTVRAGEGPAWPLLWRMIVPGWPQFYQGNPERGWCFLAAYLLLVTMALSLLGTFVGSICLGLAVSAHASSVLDIVIAATNEPRTRITYIIVCLAGIVSVVYVPLAHFGAAWVAPRQILLNLPPFARGDVVLVSPGLFTLRDPRPGDVVLYNVPGGRAMGARYLGRAANYAIEGPRIDRILAGPGQRLQLVGGTLQVDGESIDYRPLEPTRMPAALDIQAPPGYYVILPTTALPAGVNAPGMDWDHLSLVPARQITGLVYLRHWPWTRLSFF